MSKSKEGYIETEIVYALSKKGVKFNGKVAEYRPGTLGINALGKLDYLVNHLKYQIRIVVMKEK